MRRMYWRLRLSMVRLKHKLWPVNATCNNPWCGYRGRRTRRGIWCPACWDDGGGELILDSEAPR